MPQPTPVWFVRDGDTFVTYSMPNAYKVKNIRANPKVALGLANEDAGDYFVLQGEATIDESIPPATQMPAYFQKYKDLHHRNRLHAGDLHPNLVAANPRDAAPRARGRRMTTDILFGQSYYPRFDPKLYAAMQPYPPLGTLYAASIMRDAGYSVALFDAMLAESTDDWAAALDQHQPRYATAVRGQFQLPEQNVAAADARSRLHHDRRGEGARLHRHLLRRGRNRSRRPISRARRGLRADRRR